MIVVGTDPSLRNFGWCVAELSETGQVTVVDVGVEVTKRSQERLLQAEKDYLALAAIFREIERTLELWSPVAILSEIPAGSRSARSAQTGGLAWGALACAAISRDTPVRFASPADVKRAATGDFHATKAKVKAGVEQVVKWTRSARTKLDRISAKKREHVYDSIAAVWALRNDPVVVAASRVEATK